MATHLDLPADLNPASPDFVAQLNDALRRVAGGSGAGKGLPSGPPSLANPAAVDTSAPNVAVSAVSVTYTTYGNATMPVWNETVALPTGSPQYSYLKYITVEAVNAAGAAFEVWHGAAPWSGGTIVIAGTNPAILQTLAAQMGWFLRTNCFDKNYNLTPNPTVSGALTIAGLGLTVTAGEHSGGRSIDGAGGYHCQVDIAVTLADAQVPQVVTFYLSFDGGTTWQWQGWLTATTSPFTGTFTCWLPTNSTQTWKPAAINGAYNATNPNLPSGAVQGATFTIGPVALSGVTASDQVSLRWQGPDAALHAVVSFAPSFSTGFQPVILTVWLTRGGVRGWHGWIPMAASGQTLYIGAMSPAIGAPKADTAHQPTTGSIYPPVTGDDTGSTVTIAVGEYDASQTPPSGAVTSSGFTIAAPLAPGSTVATNAYVDAITYRAVGGGACDFGWGNMYCTLPFASATALIFTDPNIVAVRWTVQTGSMPGGVWTPGGVHAVEQAFTDLIDSKTGQLSGGIQRISGTQISLQNPNNWLVPSDGNNYHRIRCYVASYRNTDGTGMTWTQQHSWSSGVGVSTAGTNDHQDLIVDASKSNVTKLAIATANGTVSADPTTDGLVSTGPVTCSSFSSDGGLVYTSGTGRMIMHTAAIPTLLSTPLATDGSGNIIAGSGGSGLPTEVFSSAAVYTGTMVTLNLTVGGAMAPAGVYRVSLVAICAATGSGTPAGTQIAFAVYSSNGYSTNPISLQLLMSSVGVVAQTEAPLVSDGTIHISLSTWLAVGGPLGSGYSYKMVAILEKL